MLTVEEASARILADMAVLDAEQIPLRNALGRVLASDVHAPIALPPWDNASMDGYAVHAEDVVSATPDTPVTLPVLETVAAGGRASRSLPRGAAIRIMTGAPVPEGADSVIRVEDTNHGVDRVVITDARDAGRNVRPRGEDLAQGAVAVHAGTAIGAAQLGVLASVGAATVRVHRLPRVAVLATGDELVDVENFDAVRRGERIVSSNSYTLRAAVTAAGALPLDLGIAPDDPEELRRRLEGALSCDLLVTSGGVSVGDFDHTKTVMEELGGQLKFWRVQMRPGAPIGFGALGAVPWIGLPGNPVSTMVTFELFVRPAIRKLRGESRPHRRTVAVRLAERVTTNAPRTHFLRVIVEPNGSGELVARLTGPQGSGLLTSMARANALLIVPADITEIEAGTQARAMLIGDDAGYAAELTLT